MKDDVISRQAAIAALNKRARDNFTLADGYQWYLGALHDVADDIRQLPSVQSRKGKWIKISPANIYECSECGKNVMTDDISAYDFCHGCGADMRGEQNDY